MEKELIESVRKEICLYDVKHPDYVRTRLKDSIWKRIAEELNLRDGIDAKRAWEKLRNNHRDALRRQKKLKPKRGSEAVNIKPWRFQKNMAFLMPYMAKRITNTIKHQETQNDELSQAHSDTTENEIHEVHIIDNQECRTGNDDDVLHSEPSSSDSTDQEYKRRRHKKNDLINKSIQRREAKRKREMEHSIIDTTNDFTVHSAKNDPLFHFFMSMYETTKTLPPLSQHTIKTNIFRLVSKEESETLIKCSPTHHSEN